MEIKREKPKAFETLALNLKALGKIVGKVGWFESARYEDGTPVAFAMALQELGTKKIPMRPFFRPTAAEKKKEWSDVAAAGARAMVAGKATPHDVMEQLTAKAEGDVVQKIATITTPALSPVTIELRAMKRRDPSLKITAATVGIAARRVKQAGYTTPDVSVKPLNDTGHAIATLTHITEEA